MILARYPIKLKGKGMNKLLARSFVEKDYVIEDFDGTKGSLYGAAGTFAARQNMFSLLDDDNKLDAFIDCAFELMTDKPE